MGVTYDTGALVAADRGQRRQWARHRALLARREVPTVPAPVLAQAWRGGSRQALLSRLLTGCDIEALDDQQARSAGSLAARAGSLSSQKNCTSAVGTLNKCQPDDTPMLMTARWPRASQNSCARAMPRVLMSASLGAPPPALVRTR